MNAVVLVEVTLENQEIRQRYCKIFDLHHIITVRFGIVDKGGKAFFGLIGFTKGNDELKDLVWDEVKKLDESGEVDKLADKYELDKSMLCISEDKDKTEDSDPAESETEENADSTEKETDSESK